MPKSDDLMDDFEDADAESVETTIEYHELAKKKQNQKKVDLRRMIEARKEFSALVDEQHYLMKLDLESDSSLI